MTITIDGGAGITFPDTVQQTNALTNTGGNPRYYAARAWVNFNSVTTVSIRAAVNVSSITDLGVGYFRIIFTTAMPDGNYVVAGVSGGSGAGAILYASDDDDVLPGSCEVDTETDAGTATDFPYTSVAIFR